MAKFWQTFLAATKFLHNYAQGYQNLPFLESAAEPSLYVQVEFLPFLTPLCDKYDFITRMLETVCSKMYRVGTLLTMSPVSTRPMVKGKAGCFPIVFQRD
jgi:hypothetical protein